MCGMNKLKYLAFSFLASCAANSIDPSVNANWEYKNLFVGKLITVSADNKFTKQRISALEEKYQNDHLKPFNEEIVFRKLFLDKKTNMRFYLFETLYTTDTFVVFVLVEDVLFDQFLFSSWNAKTDKFYPVFSESNEN